MAETLKKPGFTIERTRGFQSFVELPVSSPEESTVLHIAPGSPFRFEQPADSKEFPRLKIDSLIDIATNKLLTFFGRAALRDFVVWPLKGLMILTTNVPIIHLLKIYPMLCPKCSDYTSYCTSLSGRKFPAFRQTLTG